MKRTIILVCALILVLTLFAACGGKGDGFPKASDSVVLAEDAPDQLGYTGKIAITFDGTAISAVQYDEISKSGKLKSEDPDYASKMEASTGMTPAKAIDALEKALVAQQKPAEVDAVSGATSTSDRFKKLAEKALSSR